MKEHPILFSSSMVCALLDGRKTQTRRVMSPQPSLVDRAGCWYGRNPASLQNRPSKYGVKGDRLWVREQFSGPHSWATIPPAGWGWDKSDVPIWYWADGNPPEGDWTRPKPSIHMPRRYSRITLEITDVRVQRLQVLTEDDAIAEGVERINGIYRHHTRADLGHVSPIGSFQTLWDSINAKRAPWATNPWVWALTFRRVMPS